MNTRKFYEDRYHALTPEQRKVVGDKISSLWRDPDLTGDMIRCIGARLLAEIGYRGGDTYEGS